MTEVNDLAFSDEGLMASTSHVVAAAELVGPLGLRLLCIDIPAIWQLIGGMNMNLFLEKETYPLSADLATDRGVFLIIVHTDAW